MGQHLGSALLLSRLVWRDSLGSGSRRGAKLPWAMALLLFAPRLCRRRPPAPQPRPPPQLLPLPRSHPCPLLSRAAPLRLPPPFVSFPTRVHASHLFRCRRRARARPPTPVRLLLRTAHTTSSPRDIDFSHKLPCRLNSTVLNPCTAEGAAF